MNPFADPLINYIAAVEATGQTPPADYTELLTRWQQRDTHGTAQTAYTAALLDGDTTNIVVLHAAALAEASALSTHQAQVDNIAAMTLLSKLRAIITPALPGWHTALAKQLTTHWTEFCKAADTIDPTTPPADLVGADQKARSAWLNAELSAQQCEATANHIRNVAVLQGAGDAIEDWLPLIVNTTRQTRRLVWESWTAEGRGHRWTALHRNNIPVQARPLADITEPHYRKALPLQEKLIRNGTGWARTMVDPEEETVNA